MSGIEKIPLPPIGSGVVTGDALREVLRILIRDVLRYADVRNANGTGGVTVTGDPASAATISLTEGDRGDITVSGGGSTWSIDAGAVTFAKIQPVATDTLLGRSTAGTGTVELVTCTAAGRALLDDATADAQLGTLGLQTAVKGIYGGTGTPEGAVTAPVGSLFLRTDGGASTTLYCKESGSGNTGWIPK
jgi:hypothetical protein